MNLPNKSRIAINERASLCCLWISQFTVVYKVPRHYRRTRKEKLQSLVYATITFHLMPMPFVAKTPTQLSFFVAFFDFHR